MAGEVYSKIVDRIMYLGDGLTLNMNVILSNVDDNGYIRNFYNEYTYYSSNFKQEAITIKRAFQYYLTIDKLQDKLEKVSIMIRISDMLNFINCINKATEWFAQNMYGTNKEGKLKIIGKYNPIVIDNLCGDTKITLEPTVCIINDKYHTGIRIGLNDRSYGDITVDSFMGMIYILNRLDMFCAAQNMINSFNQEKGSNRHTFNQDKMELPEPDSIIPKGRVISSKNSFFS